MAFSNIPSQDCEAAFDIRARAQAAGKGAIDCSVGEIRRDNGKLLTFSSVRAASKEIGERMGMRNYEYQSELGNSSFRKEIKKLLLGDQSVETASVATSGGCQALLLNMQLLRHAFPNIRLVRPVPEWEAYDSLTAHSGLDTVKVEYLQNGKPSIGAIADAVKENFSAVLLQESSHNPTGKTHKREELREMARIFKMNNAIALLDISYQGLSYEPEQDLATLDAMVAHGVPTLVAWSASKNHTLYSERVGLAAAIAADKQTVHDIERLYASMMLPIQSPPSSIGQDIVTTVQRRYPNEWRQDLRRFRSTLFKRRASLQKGLPEFHDIIEGEGLYVPLPLTADHVARLAEEHATYVKKNGAMCLAGITLKQIEELAKTIRIVRQ